MTYNIRVVWPFASKDSGDQSPTGRRLVLPDCKHVAVSTATSRRSMADQLQTCHRLVGDYFLVSLYVHKLVYKSHRSPVSCKEISREQVANRLQSRCKQGFKHLSKLLQDFNIAKSEQSSHTPGGSHQRLYHFNCKEK